MIESYKEKYKDWIKFLDEDGNVVAWYVKIIDTSNLITFETDSGNAVSIPPHRVIKIKKRGDVNE